MSEVKIQAEFRTEFGKGAARRIRRADKVPAVLYGHGTDPIHITLPGHDTMLALKNSNALLTIDVDGTTQLALPKQVQRDPIKGFIEHVDLLVVKKGEKVTVEVPVHLIGHAGPDSLVVTELSTIALEVEATHIPEFIELDITGAAVGTQFHARDLKLPTGAVLQDDEDLMIVNVTNAPTAEQLEDELAEAEAEVGIEKEEAEEDTAGEAAETGDADAAEAAEGNEQSDNE
ncbi:MAG TPA: 50S ribosomal protein L25/general stress protein Ctc [Nocardioidaceae bacterium]|nr:50S ribosomal protein L25/general stress protein Ctc [Nocardioidaceae bacterium]